MDERQDGNIIKRDIEQEMRTAYIDYAMSVIVSRALPDVRDGLKPVHRRILYGAHMLKAFPDRPYYKSARIVGDILGKKGVYLDYDNIKIEPTDYIPLDVMKKNKAIYSTYYAYMKYYTNLTS